MTRNEALERDDALRVIAYLAPQVPDVARFAQLLLDDGAVLIDAWGPVQMAVCHLVVQRGDWYVQFHSERGFPDGVAVARAASPAPGWGEYLSITPALYLWAHAHRAKLPMTDMRYPDSVLLAHGRDALDWLNAGNEQAFARVHTAWAAGWHTLHPTSLAQLGHDAAQRLQAETVVAMAAAADEEEGPHTGDLT